MLVTILSLSSAFVFGADKELGPILGEALHYPMLDQLNAEGITGLIDPNAHAFDYAVMVRLFDRRRPR